MRKSRRSPEKKDTSLIVSMFTHKGGVGKTTATWSFAAQLAELGGNALLVDADPQGNLTKSFILFKIAMDYPYLSDEERQEIASKVARVFLLKVGKDQLADTTGMDLVFVSDNKCHTHEDIRAAYGRQFDEGAVILYPYEVTEADYAENSRYEVGVRVWYLQGLTESGVEKIAFFCGKDKAGKESGNGFDGLSALLDDNRDKDLDREDIVFADASRLTKDEAKRILSRAALLLDREDQVVADIVDDFLNTRLTVIEDINTFDETQFESGEFLLAYSEEEQVWELCHFVKPDLADCPLLQERISLGAILNPAEVKGPRDLTETLRRKVIRAINQYYRAINFTEAFSFRFFDAESSAEKVQDHIDQLALLEIDLRTIQHQIPVLNKLPPEQLGTIRLLAGNYNILLHLGRDLSAAAHSMSKGGGLERYESNITLIHEFIRRVSRNVADVTLIDMSPSANDLNSSLLMTGDYVISASCPANYSNDAMESLVEILAAWRDDYRRLYTESHGRYVPIPTPPKVLGYFLNKSQIRDNKLDKPRADIAAQIEKVFCKNLLPLAYELGMYPAFGLLGYEVSVPVDAEPGVRSLHISGPDKVDTGIPSCRGSQEGEVHRSGMPLIWTLDPTAVRSAVGRVFGRTIGRALCHDSRVREALKLASERLHTTNTETEVEAFQKTWSRAYVNQVAKLTLNNRKQLINTLAYRYDYIDMYLLIQSMRHAIHQAQASHKLSFDEGSSVGFDNGKHVLLVDPCMEDHIKATLNEALKQVQNHKNGHDLKYIVIPFFAGYWQCVRIQVDFVSLKDKPSERIGRLHFLFDDPHGGVFEFENEKLARRQRGKENEISDELRTSVLRQCIVACNKNHPIRHASRHAPKFRRVVIIAKSIDQQGYPYNDGHDSGIITLNNAYDYCAKLSPNKDFDPSAAEYKIKCSFSNESESTVVFGERGESRKRNSSSMPHLYELMSDVQERKDEQERKSVNPDADRVTKSSLRDYVVRKYFKKHKGHYSKLLHTKAPELQAANKACIKAYRNYLSVELGRIQDAYLQAANAILNASPNLLTISLMVTVLYQKCMKGPQFSNGRERPYGDGEYFSVFQTNLAMSVLEGRSNRRSLLSPGMGTSNAVLLSDFSSSSSDSDDHPGDDAMPMDPEIMTDCLPAQHRAFSNRWIERYMGYTERQTVTRRANNVARACYRYDFVDMTLLLRVLRYKINTHRHNKRHDAPSFAEASLPTFSNPTDVYILDPCLFEHIGHRLKSHIESLVHTWKSDNKAATFQKHIIVPYFRGYWQCIRIRLNIFLSSSKAKVVKVTYDCLIDDPNGLFAEGDPSPGKAYNDHDSNLGALSSEEFISDLSSQLGDVMRAVDFKPCFAAYLKEGTSCTYDEDGSRIRFKCVDQAGYLYADNVDSGVIILRNIEDYCTTSGENYHFSSRDAGECLPGIRYPGYTLKAHYMPHDGEEMPGWLKLYFAHPEVYFAQRTTTTNEVRAEHKEWLLKYKAFLNNVCITAENNIPSIDVDNLEKEHGQSYGLETYLTHFQWTLKKLDKRFVQAFDQLFENRYKPNSSSALDISLLVHALYFEYFNGARRGAGNTQELVDALSLDDFVFSEAVCQRAYSRLKALKIFRDKKKRSSQYSLRARRVSGLYGASSDDDASPAEASAQRRLGVQAARLPIQPLSRLFEASSDDSASPARANVQSALGARAVHHRDFLGLEFQEVQRDGHCLFHAVGIFLQDGNHQLLRFNVANELEFRALPEWRAQMEAAQGSVATYVQRIRDTAEWGDHLEISVLQRILKRPIIVIRPDVALQLPDAEILAMGDPIFIFYNGHNHYDGFILKPGHDGADVLTAMQSLLDQEASVTFDPYDPHEAPFMGSIASSSSRRTGMFARERTKGPDPKRKERVGTDKPVGDPDNGHSSIRDKRRRVSGRVDTPVPVRVGGATSQVGLFGLDSNGSSNEKRRQKKKDNNDGIEARRLRLTFSLNRSMHNPGQGGDDGSKKGGSPAHPGNA